MSPLEQPEPYEQPFSKWLDEFMKDLDGGTM